MGAVSGSASAGRWPGERWPEASRGMPGSAPGPVRPASGPGGLSTGHIRPPRTQPKRIRALLTVYPEGSLVSLRGQRVTRADPLRPPSRRGRVGAFGGKSRLRLLRTLATIRRSALPMLCTLTFPDEAIPETAREAKRRLATFRRRLLRAFPDLGAVWRLGVVDRKSGAFVGQAVPHIHFLAWGVSFVELVTRMPAMWASINLPTSHPAYAKHVAAGTGVERAETLKSGAAYMAKGYIARGDPEPGPQWMGRRWGTWNRPAIPWADAVLREVAWKDFHAVRRLLARGARRHLRGSFPWQGLSTFSGSPGAYARLGASP